MTRPRPAGESGEDAIIERVLRHLSPTTDALEVGPGHDCAVVRVDGARVVISTDVLIDGVHFRLEECGPEAAGAKALLVNLSDLAAAAALPAAFEVGVVLPRDGASGVIDGVARGLASVAERYACPCAGGDTNTADGRLVIAVTVLGRPGPTGRIVTRSGARPGDVLSVTGSLGGSRGGRHLAFTPRLAEAQVLVAREIPHAMMDLSDGLSRDLPRLCRASGVGAVIDAARLPIHPDVSTAASGRTPREHALDDGEDFELLVAHAPLDDTDRARLAAAGVHLLSIGDVVDESEGVTIADEAGRRPLPPRGYDHFASGLDWRGGDGSAPSD